MAAMSTMFVACNKKEEVSKDDDINGCKCTFYWTGGGQEPVKYSLDDMEEYFDVTTCSQLEKEITRDMSVEYDFEKVSCKSY